MTLDNHQKVVDEIVAIGINQYNLEVEHSAQVIEETATLLLNKGANNEAAKFQIIALSIRLLKMSEGTDAKTSDA